MVFFHQCKEMGKSTASFAKLSRSAISIFPFNFITQINRFAKNKANTYQTFSSFTTNKFSSKRLHKIVRMQRLPNFDSLYFYTYNHRHRAMYCKVTHESKHKLVKLIERTFKQLMQLTKVVLPHYISRYYLYYIDNDGDEISLLNESDFFIFSETNKQNMHVYVKQQEILETLSNASGILEEDSILINKISETGRNLNNSSIPKGIKNNLSPNHRHQQQSYSSIKKTNYSSKYSQVPEQYNILNLSSRRQQIHNCLCNRCRSKQIIGFRYQCPYCLNFNLCEVCEKKQKHQHPLLQIKQKGRQIIHSQLRDHLNLQIPSKEHNQLIKYIEQQKKTNQNLLKLIEQMDKNQQKTKNSKSGIFRSKRKDEIFDRFFEKPLIQQNSRLFNKPRYSYMEPKSNFTRESQTKSYYNNF